MVLFEKYEALLENQYNKRFDNVPRFQRCMLSVLTHSLKDCASG